jgi:uncharacterized protein with LGFP repeats/peptidoglycan/xylan/chitin deacetylase (PgdA/CDA1 family)
MASTPDQAPAGLRPHLRPTVLAVLCVAALALGLVQAPPAAAAGSCPPPVRAVLDSTPATFASTVALTFDDGPSPQWTPQLLDILRARGVKATFFVLGSNVAAHPDIARRIVAEGHVIANHSYSHPNFDLLSPAAQAAEIDRTNQAILNATGAQPCFFRGPGGSHHGASVKDLVWSRGMDIAGWARDTLDWTTPLSLSPAFSDTIVQRATSPLMPHPTILMHDGSPGNYRQNTVNAVDRIISFYAARGYVFTDPAGRPIGTTAIQQRYQELGGPGGFLGAPVTAELPTPDGVGAFTHYQRGSIYWSPSTGPHVVLGDIKGTWAALGWENSAVGYPTTDELPTAGGTGAFNHFQRGSIYWSPATGAHAVLGSIREAWRGLGWEHSALGFPTTNELPTPGGAGAFNHFQHGSIYWSPATGAHEVRGDISAAWSALGWEQSALGFPTTDELPTPGGTGAFNHFQHGSIYWSPATGAHEVRGAIRDAWSAQGWEQGPLGFPTSDEHTSAGVQRSDFQRGFITWTPQDGAVVTVTG